MVFCECLFLQFFTVRSWRWGHDLQKARVSAMKKLDEMGKGGALAAKRNLLRDCCALS